MSYWLNCTESRFFEKIIFELRYYTAIISFSELRKSKKSGLYVICVLCEGHYTSHKFKLSKQLIIERFHSFHSNILGIDVACNIVLGADIAAAVTENSAQVLDIHIGGGECGIVFSEQVRIKVVYTCF